MTREERRLWYEFLAACAPRFRRQQIIGPYIVDFYCDKARLAVELDGSQHFELPGAQYDARRTAWLEKQGVAVCRYSNTDLQQNFTGVCEDILRRIEARTRDEQPPAGAVLRRPARDEAPQS